MDYLAQKASVAQLNYSPQIQEAMKKLEKKGMKNLILDLQGNGGGYLNIAIELADEFLSKGKLIVYTEGTKQKRQDAISTMKGDFEEGKLAILVDESSASASEILSGAVQDWDRGVIIGRRTFGKGLVQRPLPLPDGSMIRLTVARYYTPTGRCIQKPYEKGKGEDYAHDLIDRYNRGELMSADSIHFPDSMKYQTLQNKRTVYGGGGIMPDVFIPIDTTRYSDYHRDLVSKGLVNRVAMDYLDQHRKELTKAYKKPEKYKEEFEVTDEILAHLRDLADALIDNCCTKQETALKLDGKDIAPVSTIAGAAIINAAMYQAAEILAQKGVAVPLYLSSNDGGDKVNTLLAEKYKNRILHLH